MTSNTPRNSRTAVETALERLHQSTHEPQLTGQGTLAGLAATQGVSTLRFGASRSKPDHASGSARQR